MSSLEQTPKQNSYLKRLIQSVMERLIAGSLQNEGLNSFGLSLGVKSFESLVKKRALDKTLVRAGHEAKKLLSKQTSS